MSERTQSEAFAAPRRELAADTFGMWIFLASEAMLFGALLLVFLAARIAYPQAFAAASGHLSLPLGTANTVVLITSSFTMALAHVFADAGRWRGATAGLAATGALGLVFLAVKGYEYRSEYLEGLAPVLGAPFRYEGPAPANAELFFNLYFTMTALHAAHLLGGIAVVGFVLARWRRTAAAGRLRRVTATGLYWHFVDVVWIFLFPVLYLIDR
ncbi:cytochrome c oxidase subunit 3 [Aquibium sp. A9E412]|uniref:cytochrome c oxidase subunit 3 n=1 Tax=Aquibium sp. A9E412 TaxID=2976767 RepID=UPI0025B23894|nr:cytochrome c oxidase subunit 3 [Aquibium sp. A9E412]MDN2566027.1 cytochrome c oxidase subunit 3 [Aquibium sp. A9E412]